MAKKTQICTICGIEKMNHAFSIISRNPLTRKKMCKACWRVRYDYKHLAHIPREFRSKDGLVVNDVFEGQKVCFKCLKIKSVYDFAVAKNARYAFKRTCYECNGKEREPSKNKEREKASMRYRSIHDLGHQEMADIFQG